MVDGCQMATQWRILTPVETQIVREFSGGDTNWSIAQVEISGGDTNWSIARVATLGHEGNQWKGIPIEELRWQPRLVLYLGKTGIW